MRWTVIASIPDGTSIEASGMAGGICTARAHAAAAAAALYERLAEQTPTAVLVTVTIGRRTTQFPTPHAARQDLIDAVFALPKTTKIRPHQITHRVG